MLQKNTGTIEVRDLSDEEVAQNIYQCEHCGHIGTDVQPQRAYVGGHGYQPRTYCLNPTDCWRRWDQRMGLASYGLEA